MSTEYSLRPRGRSHHFRQRLALRAEIAQHDDDRDWRLFLLSFAAFFVCFYTFIA